MVASLADLLALHETESQAHQARLDGSLRAGRPRLYVDGQRHWETSGSSTANFAGRVQESAIAGNLPPSILTDGDPCTEHATVAAASEVEIKPGDLAVGGGIVRTTFHAPLPWYEVA
jgi:hypothetical protein